MKKLLRKLRHAESKPVPQTHGVEPRCIQTGGIFKLPAELIVETLSHFGDPHHNMRRERTGRGSGIPLVELVERVTVIRKLTMTCWGLRNILFPLLWEYVEGCNMFAPCPDRPTAEHMISLKNGLPAQCSYLIRNPTIGAYIQALSVDLSPTNGTKDSMDFVGCLILMPNLRSLEVFSAVPTTGSPILDRVKRDRAQFPSIRELWVTGVFAQFIGGCPNVESVGVNPGGFPRDIEDLCILGRGLKRLKRIAGIHKDYIQRVVQGYPDLQEVCFRDTIGSIRIAAVDTRAAEHLRSLKHLVVVELDFNISPFYPEEIGTIERESYRAQTETDLTVWKSDMIEILKDSPSQGRKFLRWKVYESQRCNGISRGVIMMEGELEVFPGTSL